MMLALALVNFHTAPAIAQSPALAGPPVALEPCILEYLEEEGRCGIVTVYEDRAAATGRTIDLNVIVVPATGNNLAPDPLFILAGGPGQSATEEGVGLATILGEVRQRREIVLVDVRGTARSHPLRCELASPQERMAFLHWSLSDERIASCLEGLDANPAHYTTPWIVDDLDDVRHALAYEKISLYGISYGSRAGQAYAQRHPNRVASLVIHSVVAPGAPIPLLPARYGQDALNRHLERCHSDEACRTSHPDPQADLQRALNRLEESPAIADFVDPSTGEVTQVTLNRDVFAGGLQFILYQASLGDRLPVVLSGAAEGDYGPFMELASLFADQLPHSISLGLFYSVTCAEDAPLIAAAGEEVVANATRGTFLARSTVDTDARVCASWPASRLDDSYFNPMEISAPMLLISGDLDPITPPSLAEQAMQMLPNSSHIVLAGGAHSPANDCTSNAIAAFLEGGPERVAGITCRLD